MLAFVSYAVLLFAGVVALVDPPGSIAGELGLLAMKCLAGLLVVGGLLGVFSALPGIQWVEQLGLMFLLLGAGIYSVIVLTLHVTTTGNRLLQLGFVVTVALALLGRSFIVGKRPYGPDRRIKNPDPELERALDALTTGCPLVNPSILTGNDNCR